MTRRGWGTAPSSGFETTAIIAGTSNRAFFHAAAAGLVGRIASGKQFPCTLRYESCFSALIYGDWPVSGHGHEKTENDLHGPSSFALLPYHSGSLVSGPMQKSLSSSSTPSPVTTLSKSLLKYWLVLPMLPFLHRVLSGGLLRGIQ